MAKRIETFSFRNINPEQGAADVSYRQITLVSSYLWSIISDLSVS